MKKPILFALAIIIVGVCLNGCQKAAPAIQGNPGDFRANMVKWHQQHDKKPAAAPASQG